MSTTQHLLIQAQQHLDNKKVKEALDIYLNILKDQPEHLETLYSLALLHLSQQDIQNALLTIRKAVSHYPKIAYLHNTYGVILKKMGKMDTAHHQFKRAITIDPHSHSTWNNLGNLYRTDNLPVALLCFEKALQEKPNDLNYQITYLTCLISMKYYEDALKHVIGYLKHHPNSTELLLLKSVALYKTDQFKEANKTCKKILGKEPKNADALNCLANIACAEHDYHASFPYYEKALEIQSGSHIFLMNMAHAYREYHNMTKAAEIYQRIIKENPDSSEAHFNLSACYLMTGDYPKGWREYEWRWSQTEFHGQHEKTKHLEWHGESLAGKKLLVYSEQGYGDMMMLSRFVPLIPKEATVILEARGGLLQLLGSSFDNLRYATEKGALLPEFDHCISISSLPLVLNITLDNLPNAPYLKPTEDYLQKWKKIIPDNKKIKVGIAWAGSKTNAQHFRNCTLSLFKKLFSIPNIEWFSLQKDSASELKNHSNITNLDTHINIFSDTAAAILQLDLVISIDTAVAHLAGAVGKPVWTMLTPRADWRWMLQREDSPWYPTMRLFRQPKFNDWESVFNKIHTELLALAQGDKAKLKPIAWKGALATTDR